MSRPRIPRSTATRKDGERLQKIIARAGIASRRRADALVAAGRVTVNGQVATLGARADPRTDSIKVDGKRLQPPPALRYVLLNKPRGCVSTLSDPQGRPTVLDLVPPGLRKGLFPVGRLDYHTEGLLLLTNDGEFSQRVTHPRHGCSKLYEVKVRGCPDDKTLRKLEQGVVVRGRRTAPCEITRRRTAGRDSSNTWWRIRLTEGRTRQIREMFQRVGHPVQKLRRIAIGSLADKTLPPGASRELTDSEVRRLLESARRVRSARLPGVRD